MVHHDLLRREVHRAWAWAAGACGFTLWAACGYPRRRLGNPSHGPFALDEYSTLDTIGVLAGLGVLGYGIVQLVSRQRLLSTLRQTQDAHFFARASAPRTIHELLLAVAATDGRVGAAEQDVVTRLLTRELPEKVLPQDLKNWSMSLVRPRDPVRLARSLRLVLAPDERRVVLRWCREVAAADCEVVAGESELLRRLAGALGGGQHAAANTR